MGAIYKIVSTLWFEEGVDGLIIDTAGMYSKQASLEDTSIIRLDRFIQPARLRITSRPRTLEFRIEAFNRVASKHCTTLVGKVGLLSERRPAQVRQRAGKNENDPNY